MFCESDTSWAFYDQGTVPLSQGFTRILLQDGMQPCATEP